MSEAENFACEECCVNKNDRSKGYMPAQSVVCTRTTVVQQTAGAHTGEEQRKCACAGGAQALCLRR
eukprot:scaffold311858_cov26-Tisochrysis_lutea.AAC.2